MRSAFLTDIFRSVRGSLGRFLAIMGIAALGCGFYAGLQMCGPDMRAAADALYDGTNLWDVRLISTLGFEDEDVSRVCAIGGVQHAMPSLTVDAMARFGASQEAVRITSIDPAQALAAHPEGLYAVTSSDADYLNRPRLVDGRWPAAAGECVVSADIPLTDYGIGDTIELLYGASDLEDLLSVTSFKIVGTVSSPNYPYTGSFGSTTLGSGQISQYLFVAPASLAEDAPYTEIYLTAEGALDEVSETDSYLDVVDRTKDRLEDLSSELSRARQNDLKAKAQETLDEKWDEYRSEKAKAAQELADAREELDDAARQIDEGEQELADGQRQYEEGVAEFERQKAAAYKKLDDGAAEIAKNQRLLDENKSKLARGQADYDKGLAAYRKGLKELLSQTGAKNLDEAEAVLWDGAAQAQEGIEQLEEGIAQIKAAPSQARKGIAAAKEGIKKARAGRAKALEGIAQADAAIAQCEEGIAQADAVIAQCEEGIAQADAGIAQAQEGVAQAQAGVDEADGVLAQLEPAYAQLVSRRDELTQQKEQLEQTIASLPEEESSELRAQLAAVEQGLQQVEELIGPLEANLAKAREGKAQAQAGLEKAREGLEAAQAARAQAQAGKEQAEAGRAQALAGKEKAEAGRAQAVAGKEQAEAGLTQAQEGLEQAREGLTQAREAQGQLPGLRSKLKSVQKQLAQIEEALAGVKELRQARKELDRAKATLDSGKKQLAEGQAALDDARAQLAEGRAQAERELAEAQATLDDAAADLAAGRAELDDARSQYADGLAEYEDGRAEADEKFADALAQLEDAQREIDEIERPDIYALDRTKSEGAATYHADAGRIDAIADVFPFMFFLVAALVSLTTMTRMVEDDRVQIGTYKALGYGVAQIASKYLVYAGIASIAGAVVGIVALSQVLPYIVMNAYSIIYSVPIQAFPLPINMPIALAAGGLGVGVTLLATWGAVVQSLREVPATLMLPRAPKAGKRILLERIKPLWNRLSFTSKVTCRNLFRYKRRFLMTVIGISGCTALLLVGFGLHDSIWDIIDRQYGPIIHFDTTVGLDDSAIELDVRRACDYLAQTGEVTNIVRVQNENMQAGTDAEGETIRVNVIIPRDANEVARAITFRNRISGEALTLDDDAVLVTEKLSLKYGLAPGDTILLFDQDDVGNAVGEGHALTVSGVAENYVGNYVYLGRRAWAQVSDRAPVFSTIYASTTPDDEVRAGIAGDLHDLEDVSTVVFSDETINMYRKMLSVVDMIVVVLIVSAAALAYIVLYNLTNINIGERIREIASLKVLGFTRGEVYSYIFREIALLAAMGDVLGLMLGVFLERFVVVTAEVDYVMFGRTIHPPSFAYAFALTLVFTGLVILSMRRKLDRVDMVESLKSVD